MSNPQSTDLTPEEERIAGALQVVNSGGQEVLALGDVRVPVPTASASGEEMDRFNRFLTQTSLSTIERKKQKRLNELRADAEVEVLRLRTEAIIDAHRGLAAEALAEIIIAANQFGREAIRKDELSEQVNVQRAVLKAALQYTQFLEEVPKDLPEGVREDVIRNALEVYQTTLARIRSADFRADG